MKQICTEVSCEFFQSYEWCKAPSCPRKDATTTTDGYWYHGSGKLMGEFCHIKPNDKERYGEYVKVVRCKNCKQFRLSTMYENWGLCLLANDEGYGVCREVRGDSFCSWGERKDGGEND